MLTSCYPVLMSDDVAGAARFFCDHFDFEVTFDSDWYVSLRCGDQELAFLAPDHPTVPATFGVPAQGVLVNLEVDDVDAVWRRLADGPGVEVVLPIRSEGFGQRHFIVRGPGRLLVDVITPIEPSAEFLAQFAPDAVAPDR